MATREEAIEWTNRFPNPAVNGGKAEIEVGQLFESDEFGQMEGNRKLPENRNLYEEIGLRQGHSPERK